MMLLKKKNSFPLLSFFSLQVDDDNNTDGRSAQSRPQPTTLISLEVMLVLLPGPGAGPRLRGSRVEPRAVPGSLLRFFSTADADWGRMKDWSWGKGGESGTVGAGSRLAWAILGEVRCQKGYWFGLAKTSLKSQAL